MLTGSVVEEMAAGADASCLSPQGEPRAAAVDRAPRAALLLGRRRRTRAARSPEPPHAQAPPPRPRQDFSRLLDRLAPGEDPAHVEAWLRVAHGALDDIDPLRFVREVKLAVASIHAHGGAESDELARSCGLEPRGGGGDGAS